MIVTADWLLPVTGRPLRGGAALVRGPRIERIGPLEELTALGPKESVERFDGCVIVPGLVNAHTHLSLTVLEGLIPRMPMSRFLREVTKAVLAMSHDDFAASAMLGAIQSLECGVTTVGDIVYGPEALAACADAGVGGIFYWEVLGHAADELSGELAEREFPAEVGACTSGRTRCGLSPHATYTSGPGLLAAEWKVADRHHVGYAVHVAESEAERELMITGAGPLAHTAHRLAHGFKTPRKGSVAYLDSLGVLQESVAIHCAHLEPGDTGLLKRSVRGVVLCPRSNAWLGNGPAPVSELSSAGIYLAVGTDSPASNEDLDLWQEARALRKLDPTLTARRLIAMLTVDGARVLGLHGWCGALEPGMQADLAVMQVGPTEDPENAVVRSGGRDTTQAVLSAGLWRVREGKASLQTGAVKRAAAAAREVAVRALAT
jgi:cytosine/adenosine deaminase-related metal-dependent hydrolase